MKNTLRLSLIAFTAASLGQAIAIVQVPPTFGFTSGGAISTGGANVGTVGGSISNAGQYLSLFTGVQGVTLTDSSLSLNLIRPPSVSAVGDSLTLQWFGNATNSNPTPVTTPITYLFNFAVGGQASLNSVRWSLTARVNGATAYSNLNNAFTSNPVQGSSTVTLPSGTVPTEVDLVVSFIPVASGDTLTVTVPQAGTINLGINSVPEPASFGFAAAGLLGLLSFARLRRRG